MTPNAPNSADIARACGVWSGINWGEVTRPPSLGQRLVDEDMRPLQPGTFTEEMQQAMRVLVQAALNGDNAALFALLAQGPQRAGITMGDLVRSARGKMGSGTQTKQAELAGKMSLAQYFDIEGLGSIAAELYESVLARRPVAHMRCVARLRLAVLCFNGLAGENSPDIQRGIMHARRSIQDAYDPVGDLTPHNQDEDAEVSAAHARYVLALQMQHAKGDPMRINYLLLRAARAGFPHAMYAIGKRLLHGDGAPRHPQAALTMFCAGAVRGNWQAAHALSMELLSGRAPLYMLSIASGALHGLRVTEIQAVPLLKRLMDLHATLPQAMRLQIPMPHLRGSGDADHDSLKENMPPHIRREQAELMYAICDYLNATVLHVDMSGNDPDVGLRVHRGTHK